ncbi:low molecular weight phosphotyrosine protein phosphatase-like protein [Ramicandelaber brevisporus]|nr:low molecular weight phosphotyrosine protein phosphatase-like protein [Ramicandelaber brevisporus]
MTVEEKTYSVLFVCQGNICRSPMAEAVFSKVVEDLGLHSYFARIDSAGTSDYYSGKPVDSYTAETCKRHGIMVTSRARQITQDDLNDFDYILCADDENVEDVEQLGQQMAAFKAKIELFGEYRANKRTFPALIDPYFDNGEDNFEHNYQRCVEFTKGFLAHLGLPID